MKGRVTFHAEAGAMQLAKNLIGIAAADPVDSQFVGGDIDVVVIRATGISCPQRKPRCQSAD
jgi:hypothetical protein